MNGIIVDDEAGGRRLLKTLCDEYCDGLKIIGQAASVKDAIALIDAEQPDLVFLDVQMPIESGLKLLEYYENEIPFKFILTTAHEQYAMYAFKHQAVDYLLKPIEIDELIKAVEKAALQTNEVPSARKKIIQDVAESKEINKVCLTTIDGHIYVQMDEIVACEAAGGYTKFHMADGRELLITKTLKHFQEVLPAKVFFRTHKSNLINLYKIRKYLKGRKSMVETVNGKSFEVATRRKETLLERLSDLK